MKKILVAFLLTFVSFATLHAAGKSDAFTLKTVEGKSLHVLGKRNGIEFKEHKGKVVFLEFWGTHCPPCLMSIPHYIDLKKKYADKLAIVAVEVQSTPSEQLKAFAQSHGINYDVVAHQNALDFIDYIALRTRWDDSIPFLVILDQNGDFVTSQVGLLPEEALEGVVKKLDEIYRMKSKTPSASDSNATKKN